MTREQWLNKFMNAARPQFKAAGAPLPKNVRVSIGFTSAGRRGKRIGECWSKAASADGNFEIFIVPGEHESSRIADILTHECVHAAVGLEAGHGPAFRKVATALGLEGKMTATVAGDGFHEWAKPILDKIGPIPHAQLNGGGETSSGPRKQGTRMIKCECTDCGFTFRTAAKWLEGDELQCPSTMCGGEVKVG